MVLSLTYRRPSYVASSRDSMSGDEKQKSINESITSGSSGQSHGIPDALSFDRIINGGTCPPCTTRDFMNYLKYIEYDAENLQFYLWYKDYCKRFDALSETEKALSPEWTAAQAEAEATAGQGVRRKKVSPDVAAVLEGTDFADGSARPFDAEKRDPFNDPSRTPSSDDKREMMSSDYGSSFGDDNTLTGSTPYIKKADEAFEEAGMKWKPFTSQPFRQEITRIITIYIADRTPRQSNSSDRDRTAVLHALQNTTHPSAFRNVVNTVEWSLRKQSHPNFIRWTICNGNRPRVVFARGSGVFGIVGGFLVDLLITLSHAGRGWRVIALPLWFIGIATLIAAWKGMCVVLHGMHHRHSRPWESFRDDDEMVDDKSGFSSDTLVSTNSNSYEDEPWIAKYKKRFIIRKIFDREIWIEEPALRQIQDTIFLQAVLASFILSCIFVGIFCAVPHGNLY